MTLTEELKIALKQNDTPAINQLLDLGNHEMVTEALAFTLEKNGDGTEVVEFLLNKGADAEGVNANGVSMIILAARQTSVEYMDLLVQHGADVNKTTKSGDTALTSIVQSRAIKPAIDSCVDFLLSHGADVNHQNSSNNNAVDLAARFGQFASLEKMFDFGAVLNAESKALTNAAQEGHAKIVGFLLNHGASVEGYNPGQYTPLMAAVSAGSVECIKLLLNAGADVNVHTDYGLSVMGMAATNAGDDKVAIAEECMKLLHAAGGQFEVTDVTENLGMRSLHAMARVAQELAVPNANDFSDAVCRHETELHQSADEEPTLERAAEEPVQQQAAEEPVQQPAGIAPVIAELLPVATAVPCATQPFEAHAEIVSINGQVPNFTGDADA